MQAGDAGDGRNHHAGEQLHGGDIALIKRARGRGQDFEDTESAAVMPQGRNQDGADTEAAATGEVDARVALRVVAQHDLAGTDGFGGDAGIGLEADAEVGGGASGAGAANDFVASTEGDCGSGGAGQLLAVARLVNS